MLNYDLLKTSKALSDETRLSIYRYLQQAGGDRCRTVTHLAGQFRIHPNAVRQHLAKLEEAGLIHSDLSKGAGVGRPQRIYRPTGPLPGLELLPRDYKLLSEMLLEFMAQSKVSGEVIKAFGQQWGKQFVTEKVGDPGSVQQDPEAVARLLVNQFSAWGFDPKLLSLSSGRIDLCLNNCIFREAVAFHPELVCPLLHGVLEGMLAPFIGRRKTALENGIAHGQDSCRVFVSMGPTERQGQP